MKPVPIRLFSKLDKRVAYFALQKVASNAITRSFLDTVERRQKHDDEIEAHFPPLKVFGGTQINEALFQDLVRTWSASSYQTNVIGVEGFFYQAEEAQWLACGYHGDGSYYRKPLTGAHFEDYFVFTFVRNPFTRLVSFFQDKLIYDKSNNRFITREETLREYFEFISFDDFVRSIAKMPNTEMDRHFCPQTALLESLTEKGVSIDFTGKIENLAREFPPLQQKYDLLPLEHNNESKNRNVLHKNWQGYYTPALATLVYERYKKDFQQLGYQEEYPKLLSWLKPHWRKKVQSFGRTLFSKAAP